jgi:hypothetical protein
MSDFKRILFTKKAATRQEKASIHRNKLAQRRRLAAKFGEKKRIVRAAYDYKLRLHKIRSILVDGYFKEDKEWLVEKNLLANSNDSFFLVPNMLISSPNLYFPVANPMDQPRMIRKGEAIGMVTDPIGYFD